MSGDVKYTWVGSKRGGPQYIKLEDVWCGPDTPIPDGALPQWIIDIHVANGEIEETTINTGSPSRLVEADPPVVETKPKKKTRKKRSKRS